MEKERPPPPDLSAMAEEWALASEDVDEARAVCRFYCAALRGLRPATPEQLARLEPAGIGDWIAAMWHPEPHMPPHCTHQRETL
jgi:hypothetical protein